MRRSGVRFPISPPVLKSSFNGDFFINNTFNYIYDVYVIAYPFNTTINLETGEIYQDAETGEYLKFVGKAKLMDYLHTHEDFLKDYSEMLTKYISEASTKVDLLDEKDMKEILEQEKALNAEIPQDDPDDEK